MRHRLTIEIEIEGIGPDEVAANHVAGDLLDIQNGAILDVQGERVRVWVLGGEWVHPAAR